jgi:FkbM family methyltransferase
VFLPYQSLSWKSLAQSDFDAELLLIEFLITQNTVFFDIGSNKGEYAFFAEKLMPSKNIYLFEPEKKLFRQLQRMFPKSNVFDIAISDSTGTRQFKIPEINGVIDNCLSSLEVERTEVNETQSTRYDVNTDTLDNFTKRHRVRPSLIKIDVEGHELSVLDGAINYINREHPTFIIEIEQRHHEQDINFVFDDFKKQGYNCYYYSKEKAQLLPYNDKSYLTNSIAYFGTKDYVNNYIFIHESNGLLKRIANVNTEIHSKINS